MIKLFFVGIEFQMLYVLVLLHLTCFGKEILNYFRLIHYFNALIDEEETNMSIYIVFEDVDRIYFVFIC